jgi:hypothetical protein
MLSGSRQYSVPAEPAADTNLFASPPWDRHLRLLRIEVELHAMLVQF